MNKIDTHTPAAWQAADLKDDRFWVFQINDTARTHMLQAVKKAHVPDRPLFDYTREDFDFDSVWPTISKALNEAHHGRGMALVRGLPREGLSEQEYELMNWAIGLHTGVARPQGIASQYISSVRDVGMDYRTSSGRGYSSNAKLDFHVDGCDLVTLTCYNKAKSGGQSMITSSLSAYCDLMTARPDLAEVTHQKFYFSRQNEEAPGEALYYSQPLYDFADGRMFGKWNRNRVRTGQEIEGVPQLTAAQREATDMLDEILQDPKNMYTMYLEPGDLQILNNHVMLHSRTDYIDYDTPEKKRLLCRLWLSPPDSILLPESWKDYFWSITPGTVRGGIRGHHQDETCRAYEQRQAASLGMPAPDYTRSSEFSKLGI